jgi:hypothetical protein
MLRRRLDGVHERAIAGKLVLAKRAADHSLAVQVVGDRGRLSAIRAITNTGHYGLLGTS